MFAFLDDARNHWQLASSSLQVLALAQAPRVADRDVLVIRGPLGIRRRVPTTVLESSEASALRGIARMAVTPLSMSGGSYRHESDGFRFVLSADVRSLGFTDGLLLALGGRDLDATTVAATIERLSGRLSIAASTPVST